MAHIGIIGSGFSGLAAACSLAADGHKVTIFEKNEVLGGRARVFEADGFKFDMGPSWYWMPDVFEQFFNKFGQSTSDLYELVRLDPSYRVVFGKGDEIDMPADYASLKAIFESIESGSGQRLDEFLAEAEYKYNVGMSEYVWKAGDSMTEYLDMKVIKSMFKIDMLTSIAKQVRSKFQNEKLRKILEFPVLFLGATAENTPALYSLMNYADIKLGTWYPLGGMCKIVEAMVSITKNLGVEVLNNTEISSIRVTNGKAHTLSSNKGEFTVDYIVASGDYHHVEQNLLIEGDRVYDDKYWDSRSMAPSSLLFYLGYDTKIDGLVHHNLFFDKDFSVHAAEIYETFSWPSEPLFYLCCPSKTDSSIAPSGGENVFLLMPIATGLDDSEEMREKYFEVIATRLYDLKGIDIKKDLVYKRSYCLSDFKSDYHAYKGNAYGLSNTLKQTAFLKPKMRSAKVKNLFYTGQLTTPGPGVPPALISGQVVAKLIHNETLKK